MEEKEIDIMSRNWSRNTSNKVVKEKTKKVSKNRVQKIIKKYTFVGAFAIVLGMNAKNAIDDIQMNIAVEEAFEPIEQAAQQIVSSNASIAFKGPNQPQSQYDHLEIAQDIRAFTEQYGDMYTINYKKRVINPKKNTLETKIISVLAEVDVNLPEANLVFVKNNGEFEGTDTTKYPFKIIHYELGIDCRFHDFRDTHATRLIEAGADIKSVSKRLGHKNIQTTYDLYVRVTEKMGKGVSDLFEVCGAL